MWLRLVFKQAIRDFNKKMQLYVSFTVFILISIALVIGLFSFNFTIQNDFRNVENSTLPINYKMKTFPFTSVNGDLRDSLKSRPRTNTFQVENGQLSQYVFDEIFKPEFQVNADGQILRSFTNDELTVLWADLGIKFVGENKTIDMNTYFDDNVINFIGSKAGTIYYSDLAIYQEVLRLTDNDVANIIDLETGAIIPNDLSSKPNSLRFAAFAKINFFVRTNNRWFSNEPDNPFYDRNAAYNSNLLNKYVLTTKIDYENNLLKGTDQTIYTGSVPGYIDIWHQLEGIPGADIAEAYLPGEEWMEPYLRINNKTTWNHIPKSMMRNEITNLVYYERLALNQIPEEILISGNYAYVTPQFLKNNGLKLGDQVSHFSANYESGYETVMIIGTAVSKQNIFDSSKKSSLFIPFAQLIKRNWIPTNVRELSFPKLKNNFEQAANLAKTHFYNDFQKKLINTSTYDNFLPLEYDFSELEDARSMMVFYNLLAYSVGILTLILLAVVFYFITEQSIKLQKTTLRFLKSLGENNYELSLITTLSSLVPIFIGTVLGILLSFGVSEIMISVTTTTFPFYIPTFVINPWAWLMLAILVILIFLIFLAMNFLIISGNTLKLGQNSSIGLITKGYLAIKPIFNSFKPSVRIGISFIAKNVFKNILTFVLLTFSFGAVLFSVQFKTSSETSAHSFEQRYTPFKSVLIDGQNSSDSSSLNIDYLKNFFPNMQEDLSDKPELVYLENLFKTGTYYKGPITTYLDDNEKYSLVETGKEIELTPIKREGQISGDQKFNELVKHQIDEVLDVIQRTIDMKTSQTFNPTYDLKNYYLDKSYVIEILAGKQSSVEHAKVIFNFNETEVTSYAQKMQKIIRTLEGLGITIAQDKSDAELLMETTSLFFKIQESAIIGFSSQLDELKGTAIQVKNNFPEFDLGINLYFNRDILSANKDQRTVFATDMRIKGWKVVALGLDERNEDTFKMITNPWPILKANSNNFNNKYLVTSSMMLAKQQTPVRAIDVYISGRLADQLNIKRNEVLKVEANAFAFDNAVSPEIYIHVAGIIHEASAVREIYFNKLDIFNYLKVSLESEYSPSELLSRADYNYYAKTVDLIKNLPNGADLFNNSSFSLTELPYGISHLGLNGNLGTAYSLLGYNKLPILKYASENNPGQLVSGVYLFSAVTASLMNIINPITKTLNWFIALLLLITIAVALILIMLILSENKNVILLFKSLGYKKSSVNIYITLGYIIATIFAFVLGILIAYFGIGISSKATSGSLQMSLFFVPSVQFFMYGIIMALSFIALTLISVTIYTNKQQPKDAFSVL